MKTTKTLSYQEMNARVTSYTTVNDGYKGNKALVGLAEYNGVYYYVSTCGYYKIWGGNGTKVLNQVVN